MMHLFRICCLLTLPFLAIQCGNDSGKKSSKSVIPTDTCNCANLTKKGDVYQKGGQPYSGYCANYYPDLENQPYEVLGYQSGKLTKATYLNRVGKITNSKDYTKARNSCKCGALKVEESPVSGKKIKTLDGKPFTGVCYKRYPDVDQVSYEEHYKDGRLHGNVKVYNKMGELLSESKYMEGELVQD